MCSLPVTGCVLIQSSVLCHSCLHLKVECNATALSASLTVGFAVQRWFEKGAGNVLHAVVVGEGRGGGGGALPHMACTHHTTVWRQLLFFFGQKSHATLYVSGVEGKKR